MSTRSFTHPIRPGQILLVAALCGVLATSVLGAGKDRKPDSDDTSGKRSATARESQSYRSDSSVKTDNGRDTAKQSDRPRSYEPAARDRGDWSSRYGDDWDKSTSRRSGDYYRPGQRPGTTYQQPTETAGKHDRDYRPDYRSYPPVDNRTDRNWDKTSVYKSERDRDYYGQHRSYKGPTYRGGYYYYQSSPSYYNNKPRHYGYWMFDNDDPACCRRSVYFYFGYFPYVETVRIHVTPRVVVSYYSRPIVIGRSGYYGTNRAPIGLDNALSDIRDAWMDGRFDLIDDHLNSRQMVAIMLDGQYDYSLSSDDYAQMTADALDQIQTSSFTWESVKQRTDGNYTAFGKHTFRDASGRMQSVYVSYTLQEVGRDYVIVEVGSGRTSLI